MVAAGAVMAAEVAGLGIEKILPALGRENIVWFEQDKPVRRGFGCQNVAPAFTM
jgi:hypothetical protein